MSIINSITAQAPLFMMVFIRLTAFMSFVPFFENRNFIVPVKVGFSFLLSILLFPTIDTSSWVIPTHIASFILVVSQEILIGILMGLTFLILLFGLQMTGRMLGFQMAFSMANVMDTTFDDNANVLSVFLVMLGTLTIIMMGGDHYLLIALQKSFTILIPGSVAITKEFLNELSVLVVGAFVVGFKLAIPAVILLLCIDLTLGLIGRASAKMQIFFVGLPLKISLGLFSFTIIMGFLSSIWGREILKLPENLLKLFNLMKV